MVSKTRDDFPEPDTPVTTLIRLCGRASEMFLRLWTRAPLITMESSREPPAGARDRAVSIMKRFGDRLADHQCCGRPACRQRSQTTQRDRCTTQWDSPERSRVLKRHAYSL